LSDAFPIQNGPRKAVEASGEVGLETKTEKTKYVFMSHSKNAG